MTPSNRFARRAQLLRKMGARPWRAAPPGGMRGYDQTGFIPLQGALDVLVKSLIPIGATLALLFFTGFLTTDRDQADLIGAVRRSWGSDRYLSPTNLRALASLDRDVLHTIAEAIASDQPDLSLGWLSRATSASSPGETTRRRSLVALARWLSAKSDTDLRKAFDLFSALASAMQEPELLDAMRQLTELPPETRLNLFADNRYRLSTLLSDLQELQNSRQANLNTADALQREMASLAETRAQLSRKRGDASKDIQLIRQAERQMEVAVSRYRGQHELFRACYNHVIAR